MVRKVLTEVRTRRLVWMRILAGAAALGVALACGSGGDESTDGTSGGDAEQQAVVAKMGEKARDGKFEFVVTKVDRGKTKIGNQYLSTKAQGEFVLIHVTVRNISKEPQTFSGEAQKLFADGAEHTADTEAAIYLGEESQSIWEEINPGNTVKGIVVFDIKKGAELERLELHDSVLSGGVEVRL
ncbi:MAG TPA: DUF4352 domain-containing protein [Micromonosporaceae bacterium]|jgi:hypothetical protein|nr:DUF4352 domain-containing protein [Micromonosporaceae bacterium]